MNIVKHLPLFNVGVSSGNMPGCNIPGFSRSTMSTFMRNYQTEKHVAVGYAELVVVTRLSQIPGKYEAPRTQWR